MRVRPRAPLPGVAHTVIHRFCEKGRRAASGLGLTAGAVPPTLGRGLGGERRRCRGNTRQWWSRRSAGSASVTATHLLDDIDKHNVVLRGDLSLKIVRGLRLNASAYASCVTDQIYISADGETDAEILLNLRTRESDFNYGFNFGFSYRFGSKFNNVVNNRFR